MKTINNVELNEDRQKFLQKLTRMDNTDDAFEHFCIVCLEYFLDPEEVLNNINPSTELGFTTRRPSWPYGLKGDLGCDLRNGRYHSNDQIREQNHLYRDHQLI